MKPPAFQFYADDFLAGVADMTQNEVGAYILLLCNQWSRGEIPVDKQRLELVAKGDVSQHVLSKFPCGRNVRMEAERQKQDEWRQKQRLNGIASGKARLNGRSTTVQPSLNDTPNQTATKTNSPYSSFPFPPPITTKLTKAIKLRRGLAGNAKETADMAESLLGDQWMNDAGKWINRIKDNAETVWRVMAEVKSAVVESRIATTPAQYAEQIWKEFTQ